jgi:hypothetical protein
MGLNDIQLREFIIEEWFKDCLVAQHATTPPPSAKPTPKPPRSTIPTPEHTPNTTPPTPEPAATAQTVPSAPAKTSSPKTPTPQAPIKCLGNNRRNITLLVQAPTSPFLPDNQLAFLTKILEACRVTLADVAIVNHAAAPVTITELKQQLQPKIILLFGLEPAAIRLPINFPAFRPQDYDGCTYLSAPGLEQLVPNTEESKLLKSKLWVCLKTIFDV